MNFNCKIESGMGAKTRTADSTFIVEEWRKTIMFQKVVSGAFQKCNCYASTKNRRGINITIEQQG